ncbi:hypothetical protein [Joostella sp. CR20]|uniref:hypothetical protein n=1 Tax=Joostella sp. CR20 TaxID=2804312 RepID=UPI00313D400C
MPIILNKFKVEEVNVWFLYATIVGIGQGIQYGFNSTFIRFFSYSFAGIKIKYFFKIKNKITNSEVNKFDKDEFSDLFSVLKITFLLITTLYFLLLISIGSYAVKTPISYLENPNEGWITWFVVVISTSFNIYMSIYQIFLRGFNKIALLNRIITIVNLFGIIVILIIGLYFASLLSLIIGVQFIAILTSVSLYIMALKANNCFLYKVPKRKFRLDIFKEVWDSAWKSGTATIFATIMKHVSGIIVAQLFSPVTSASFLLTKRLFELLETLTMVTFQAKIPEIASLRGVGDIKRLIPLLRRVLTLSYGVYVIGVFVLLFFGDFFISLIKANSNLGSPLLIISFTFSTLIVRWAGINLAISNQANYVYEHIIGTITFIFYFIFVLLLYKYIGVIVFPISIMIATMITAPIIINRTYKTLDTTFIDFEKYIFFPTLLLVIILCAIYIFL